MTLRRGPGRVPLGLGLARRRPGCAGGLIPPRRPP